MADASNETSFIQAMNEGKDPHCFAGSLMFKREITKADKELRQKSKTINFGKPYGMGPSKLAKTLKCSMPEAKELFDLYAAAFPNLNKWLEDQGKFAVNNLYSKTLEPCKRRRWYPKIREARNLRDNDMLSSVVAEVTRFGMNHPIQGSGADIVKEALVEARNLVIQYNTTHNKEVARLLITVHDEIDCEVLEEFSQEFANKLEELMIMCGNKYVTQVNMEVDTTITKVWQK
jgi:DNA polymerase-1